MADLESNLNQNKESPSASGGGLLMGALGLGSGLINSIGSYLGMKAQSKEQKELLDYQWRNMFSPHAQVSNWAAEGFNPAAMFGNQSQPANVGSMPSITAPQFGVGTMDMSSLASYISAIADAKKKGVEMPNIREDTNTKIIDNDRKQYELELLRKYGDKKEYQALALAEQKVKLAMQQNDLNEQQKAINEYLKAKEAALQVTAEHQRDILKKELDNKDVELKLRNEESKQRAAASKASASASYASADASYAHARELNASAEGKELLNNISRATNLVDIDNALFNADTLVMLQQSVNKQELWQQLQRDIKNSSAYKNSENQKRFDASLEKLRKILGINFSVGAHASN